MRLVCRPAAVATLLLLGIPVGADEVDVVNASASCDADRRCVIRATLRHDDTGWEHFANRWEVLAPDGRLLATRVLRHPHVREQPFTRALPSVDIPTGVDVVHIRAYDLVHADGGAEFRLELPLRAASEPAPGPDSKPDPSSIPVPKPSSEAKPQP